MMKSQMEKKFQLKLQKYQDAIFLSLTNEHNQEILHLKHTHDEEITTIKESCSQQVTKPSRRSALVGEMFGWVKEEVVAVNQALYIAQKSLFTQVKELLCHYQELELLRYQLEVQEEVVSISNYWFQEIIIWQHKY